MSRVVVFSIGLLLTALSVWLLTKDISSRAVVASGTAIASGAQLTLEDLDKVAAYNKSAELSCRRDVQQRAMRLSLAVLETRLQGTSAPEQLSEAYRDAVTASQNFLACFPLAADGWLRSAMTIMKMEGPVERVFSHVELSQLTGPREAWILVPRIPFLMSLRQTNDPRVVEALNRDLDTLFRRGQLGQALQIYEAVGPYGKDLMRSRLKEANLEVLAAQNEAKLERLFSMLELKATGEECARYFYRLKTCVGKR